MKKSAFTLIELIFVIVILGILAAVAIPKIAASRDDAKLSKARVDLGTCINDLGGRYTAKGFLTDTDFATNTACVHANQYSASLISLKNNKDGVDVDNSIDGFGDFESSYQFGGTNVSY